MLVSALREHGPGYLAEAAHDNRHRCIFSCRYAELTGGRSHAPAREALRVVLRPRA